MARAGLRRRPSAFVWALIATISQGAGSARAADADEITLDRMRLSTDRSGILSVEGGEVLPHLGLAGAAWLGYANDPLVLHRLADGPRVGSLVNDRWSGAVSAAIGVLDRAQLGVEVPVVFHQARSGGGLVATAPSIDASGVGSLRLVPKLRLLDAASHGLDLAVLASVTVPLDPDTDGDGLPDGVEDADHDGTVDPGETDPRDPDTDGDGILDGLGARGGGCASGPGGAASLLLVGMAALRRRRGRGVETQDRCGRTLGQREPRARPVDPDERSGSSLEQLGYPGLRAIRASTQRVDPRATITRIRCWRRAHLQHGALIRSINQGDSMARAGVRWPTAVVRWTLIAVIALLARGALAASPEEITLDRMRLSTDRSGILSVESGEVLPHLGLAGAAWLGYANDQLVLHRLPDGPRIGSLVNDRWSGAVSAGIGILDRAQLSLEVPVVFHQASSGQSVVGAPSSLDAFGVGSLRLVPKVRLLDAARHGIDLAVQVGVSVPLGADGFVGSELGVQPELAASRTLGDLRLAGDLGANLRDDARLLDEKLGSELNGQVGAAYGLKTVTGLPLELGAVLAAAVSASRPFDRSDETSVELRGFGAYDVIPAVRVLAGAGYGLETGWGTPDWRVFAGVQVAIPRKAAPAPVAETAAPAPKPAPPPDSDGDGILDRDDRCPKEAGPKANRGCPDQDRDGDGVVDRLDQCPDLAGPKDNRGCPVKGAAKLEGDRITLEETVYFDTAEATIQARSNPLLDSVASIMKAHPEIGRVRVEGHTDSRGSRSFNVNLSKRRAEAVVRALVQRGVGADRLESAGFGPDRPVADNGTDEGRAKNRRVDLNVIGGAK